MLERTGEATAAPPRFSEVDTGFAFEPLVQDYLQETIDRYALASLDMNPVHTNIDWAARAQVFGIPQTVGHGMMTMSSLASVVTRQWGVLSADGGHVRFVEAKFTKPVKVGEIVTATAKVKSKHHHGPGKNWVRISVEARDSSGEVVALADVGYGLPD
jgi:phosphate acetyltransferase